MDNPTPPTTSRRGFASMDKQRQKAIARKGGMIAHERGTAHKFNSTEAAQAAKMGHQLGSAHEFNTEEARVAGRKGGIARALKRNLGKSMPTVSTEPMVPPTPATPTEPANTLDASNLNRTEHLSKAG